MRPTDPTTEKLLRLAEPVCKGAGYELVDLVLAPSREGLVLRVFIDSLPLPVVPQPADTAPGAGADEAGEVRPAVERSEVSLADCERLSRELGTALDVEDVIGPAYHLEVSSPGVDRPLRTLEHFRRFIGQEARLRLHDGIEGRRNFKGVLLAVTPTAGEAGVGEEGATITVDTDGKPYELPFDDIESARLVPDWDAIMAKSAGKRASGTSGNGSDSEDGSSR
jgi:ribosome maturation factor RimP